MKPRQPDWCRVLLAADWLVKHLILQALLPGLTPGQIKDLKRRERKARERRRYFAKLDAAGSHRDSRSVGEARAEEAAAAGAAASVAAVIVRFTSDNIRSRILSSPACGGSPGQAISFLSPARARLLEKNLGNAVGPELGIEHDAFLVP